MQASTDQPLAIDFVNSRRAPADHDDLIGDYERLAAWLDAPLPASLPDRRALFEEAHRLRRAIAHLLESIATSRPFEEASLAAINRILDRSCLRHRLERSDSAANGVETRTATNGPEPTIALVPIALDAALLAERADRHRLRRCAAVDCPKWFLDTSKGGRRRWCSMATCGNRNKAARFRERHE